MTTSNPVVRVRLIAAALFLLLLLLPAAAAFVPSPVATAAQRRSRLTATRMAAAAPGPEAGATRRAVLGQGAGLALLSGALLGGSGRVGSALAAAGAPEVTDKVSGWVDRPMVLVRGCYVVGVLDVGTFGVRWWVVCAGGSSLLRVDRPPPYTSTSTSPPPPPRSSSTWPSGARLWGG